MTLRVIGGAFNAVAHEMAQTAMRMSFSSIIRESEDLGAGLFDADGEELCESDTTPLQAGPLPWSIRGILERMRETGQEIEDGDVFIHNHPYHGASHSPDVMIAVPIFHEGAPRRLVGLRGAPARHRRLGAGHQPGLDRPLGRGQDLLGAQAPRSAAFATSSSGATSSRTSARAA